MLRLVAAALGVVAVEELVVGVPDVEHEAAMWQRLLDPVTAEQPNCGRPANGPARLIAADQRHVARLVLRVHDLAVARQAWASIDRTALRGMTIDFIAS